MSWSETEDRVLIQKQAALGNKWTQIQTFLPGRSKEAARGRWLFLQQMKPKTSRPAIPGAIPFGKPLSAADWKKLRTIYHCADPRNIGCQGAIDLSKSKTTPNMLYAPECWAANCTRCRKGDNTKGAAAGQRLMQKCRYSKGCSNKARPGKPFCGKHTVAEEGSKCNECSAEYDTHQYKPYCSNHCEEKAAKSKGQKQSRKRKGKP